jgi:hypothetical protein
MLALPSAQALEREAVPEALAKATSVLAGVKARGLAAGDAMDAHTEQLLWPQIVNEALARSVVGLVRRQHRRQHRQRSLDPKHLALPPLPPPKEASNNGISSSSSSGSSSHGGAGGGGHATDAQAAAPWELEQLEADTAAQLGGPNGYACVDGFLGDDWPALVLEDVLRLVGAPGAGAAATAGASAGAPNAVAARGGGGRSSGVVGADRMTAVPVPERVASGSWGDVLWLRDATATSADYPALSELVSALHALPYELNKQLGETTAVPSGLAAVPPPLTSVWLTVRSRRRCTTHRKLCAPCCVCSFPTPRFFSFFVR